MLRRIHQLVGQRNELRAQLEQRPTSPQPHDPTPGDDAGSEGARERGSEAVPATLALQQLDAQMAQLKAALKWARENPDGGTLRDKQGQAQELSADRVAELAEGWQEDLTRTIARREHEALRAEDLAAARQQDDAKKFQTAQTQALAEYPWLGQRTTPEWVEAKRYIDENPGITNLPEWPLIVGAQVVRRMRTRTAGGGAGNGAAAAAAAALLPAPPLTRPRAAAVPTPVVTSAGPTPVTLNPTQQRIQEVEERVARNGGAVTVKDRQELNRLRRQLAS